MLSFSLRLLETCVAGRIGSFYLGFQRGTGFGIGRGMAVEDAVCTRRSAEDENSSEYEREPESEMVHRNAGRERKYDPRNPAECVLHSHIEAAMPSWDNPR